MILFSPKQAHPSMQHFTTVPRSCYLRLTLKFIKIIHTINFCSTQPMWNYSFQLGYGIIATTRCFMHFSMKKTRVFNIPSFEELDNRWQALFSQHNYLAEKFSSTKGLEKLMIITMKSCISAAVWKMLNWAYLVLKKGILQKLQELEGCPNYG